jgi:hypothetical protein
MVLSVGCSFNNRLLLERAEVNIALLIFGNAIAGRMFTFKGYRFYYICFTYLKVTKYLRTYAK